MSVTISLPWGRGARISQENTNCLLMLEVRITEQCGQIKGWYISSSCLWDRLKTDWTGHENNPFFLFPLSLFQSIFVIESASEAGLKKEQVHVYYWAWPWKMKTGHLTSPRICDYLVRLSWQSIKRREQFFLLHPYLSYDYEFFSTQLMYICKIMRSNPSFVI